MAAVSFEQVMDLMAIPHTQWDAYKDLSVQLLYDFLLRHEANKTTQQANFVADIPGDAVGITNWGSQK